MMTFLFHKNCENGLGYATRVRKERLILISYQEEKKEIAEQEKQNSLKGLPPTLKLLPPSESDALEAKKVFFFSFRFSALLTFV